MVKPERMVKQAYFKSAHIAEQFAEDCQRAGFKAFSYSLMAKFPRPYKVVGYGVQWAPTWEHFAHDSEC